MRSLATWAVVGALVLLGLLAARDTLRSDEAAPAAGTAAATEERSEPPSGPARPLRIVSRDRLADDLRALGANGVLYLTDADCRRLLLSLPDLRWTTPQGLPGPDCPRGTRSVVDERFGLEASQVDADVIEVRSAEWRLRFQGISPAFTPEGRLTFLRSGRLWEWTVQCPPAAERVIFRGFRALSRCPRPVAGAPPRLRELVWLNSHDFAAVAGGDYYSTLLAVQDGKASTIFRAIGAGMGALQASPTGRYVAVRIDGDLATFDVAARRPVPLPPGWDGPLRAVAWSPDDRFGVLVSRRAVHVYPMNAPWRGVTVPVAAVALDWR
jgi:hypothetical protein